MEELFKELKNEIKALRTAKELKGVKTKIKSLNILINRKIKEIIIENPSENTKIPTMASINRIAQFLNETIFSKNIKEIKTVLLYKTYKEWNKKDQDRKTYGKQKFYSILKLGKRVEFKHTIDGDYFVFKYEKEYGK